MNAPTPEPKVSPWVTRALVVTAMLLLVINALLSWLSQAGEHADDASTLAFWPYQSARLLGAAVAMALFVVVAIAGFRVAGGAKTLASKAKIACCTLAVLLVLNCSMFTRMSRTDVTEAERSGLRVTAGSVTHALFGFTIPISGVNLTRSSDLERRLMASVGAPRNVVAWVLRDTVKRQALIVEVAKLRGVNESRFREFTTGMVNVFSKSAVVEVVDSAFTWHDSQGEFALHVVQPPGVHLQMRCLGRTGRAAIVCVQTKATDSAALETSRAGLALVP